MTLASAGLNRSLAESSRADGAYGNVGARKGGRASQGALASHHYHRPVHDARIALHHHCFNAHPARDPLRRRAASQLPQGKGVSQPEGAPFMTVQSGFDQQLSGGRIVGLLAPRLAAARGRKKHRSRDLQFAANGEPVLEQLPCPWGDPRLAGRGVAVGRYRNFPGPVVHLAAASDHRMHGKRADIRRRQSATQVQRYCHPVAQFLPSEHGVGVAPSAAQAGSGAGIGQERDQVLRLADAQELGQGVGVGGLGVAHLGVVRESVRRRGIGFPAALRRVMAQHPVNQSNHAQRMPRG